MNGRRAGSLVVGGVLVAAVAGPWLVPDGNVQVLAHRLAAPSWQHPFGLDELGRDILGRVLTGARVSLAVGTIVVGLSVAMGTAVGSVAGYHGRWVDAALGRAMDVLLAFPGILLAIALVAVLGPHVRNVVAALVVIGWVGYARLVRGQVLRAREFDYVQAARAAGATTPRVLWRHVLPNAWPAVTVQATLGMAGVILSEAALSFLGLGVQPPDPSWGAMISGGRGHLMDAPHLTVFPGLALALVVLGFNVLGDGLRDWLDPRSDGRQSGVV